MKSKELIIHCGLHKTGTTSLQYFLERNRDALLGSGILYPRTGIPMLSGGEGVVVNMAAHHNLAWKMMRDRRFRSTQGSFDGLFAEIADFPGRVVLSSEDFESSLLHPERWVPHVARAAELGFAVTFVIYTRPVHALLESIYLELVRTDIGEEFSTVARRVVESGKLNVREWEFCFDYRAIAKAMSTIPGATVQFRDHGNLVGGSTISDFGDLLGFGPGALFSADLRENRRNGLDDLLVRFMQRRDPGFGPKGERLRTFHRRVLGTRRARLVTPAKLRATLQARFGGNGAGRESVEDESEIPLNIARVFSFETHIVLSEAFELAMGDGDAEPGGAADIAARRKIVEWWQWVSDLS